MNTSYCEGSPRLRPKIFFSREGSEEGGDEVGGAVDVVEGDHFDGGVHVAVGDGDKAGGDAGAGDLQGIAVVGLGAAAGGELVRDFVLLGEGQQPFDDDGVHVGAADDDGAAAEVDFAALPLVD